MTASTIATEVVAAQIAGLDAEIARIDEQVANLKDRREGVVLIKEALLPLVAHVSHRHITGTGAIGAPAVMVASANGRVSVTGVVGSVVDAVHPPNATGFRAAVRKVLRDNPKGLRPSEVLQELEKRGELVRYTGKSKPSDRVHNELYVLKKAHVIVRRNNRYILNPEATNTVN
jgi:hypothetical protein